MVVAILTLGLLLTPAAEDSLAHVDAKQEISVVEVEIAPVRVKDGGKLLVALFADEETWLDLEKAFARKTLSAGSDTLVVSFRDVPFGEYALEVLHDKNENGKLDMRRFLGGWKTEWFTLRITALPRLRYRAWRFCEYEPNTAS